MIDNLFVAVYTFAKRMLTSYSVHEILPPRFVNCSPNSRDFPLKVAVATLCVEVVYLFHDCSYERVHSFPKSIRPKVNVLP